MISNLSEVKYITDEDIRDVGILQSLEDFSDDAEFDLEPGRAREFYDTLQGLVNQYSGQIETNPELYRGYAVLLWKMMWKSLPTFVGDERVHVLKKNLVFSIRNGVQIKNELAKLVSIYEFGIGPNNQIRSEFIRALENNPDMLGSSKIQVAGMGDVAPTIKNWIADYNANITVAKPRAAYEQIEYLNTGKNVKILDSGDKKILQEIISLYDWLKFPPPGPEIEMPKKREVIKAMDMPPRRTESFEMPELPKINSAPTKPRPVPSQPKPNPKEIEELYDSTLEELHKMREEHEPVRQEVKVDAPKIQAVPHVPEIRHEEKIIPHAPQFHPKPKPTIPHAPQKPKEIGQEAKISETEVIKKKQDEVQTAVRRALEAQLKKLDQAPRQEIKPRKPFSINEALIHGRFDYEPDKIEENKNNTPDQNHGKKNLVSDKDDPGKVIQKDNGSEI